jgi:phthiodiolone/phenolphthiodiolone dimycocerosates ketoreductase
MSAVQTAIPFDDHRTTPLGAIAPFTHFLRESGVDFLWLWDELSGWFPRSLWRPEVSPMAAVMDGDSTYDPFIEAAFALAADPSLNVRLSTDAIRNGPAELMRKLYTLQSATDGQVTLALGAGELRQTRPFGYRRAEGLARMEDLLQLSRLLWEADEPFDFAGNHWTFRNGFVGTTRPARRPQIWALGGGPRLLELAARYCDGFEAAVPQAISTPERYAATVASLRAKVEGFGRDPEEFGFGVWLFAVVHEDPDLVTRALENPVVKYFAGQFGRLDADEWRQLGHTPVMPDGWHYAMKWVPFSQSAAEVDDVVARTTTAMARDAFVCGSAGEVAARAHEYVEAGATFVGIADMLPLALGPSYAQAGLAYATAISAALKGAGVPG